MHPKTRLQLLLACSTCLLIGWLIGQSGTPSSQAKQATAMVEAPVFPMTARLGANLYLQTSAEYRACCLQIYRCAAERLETLVKAARADSKPLAVVMDLDETLFDNSAFQTFLYENQLEYSDELWSEYEANHWKDIKPIPGAEIFLSKAIDHGVTVILLSNRSEKNIRKTAIAYIWNFPYAKRTKYELFLKPEGGPSNKDERRAAVSAKYNVLMYVGDNLRDFSEKFAAPKLPADATPEDYRKAIERRANILEFEEKDREHWGHDWFILPNPVYGEWEKLIGPDPQALFRPTTMKAP